MEYCAACGNPTIMPTRFQMRTFCKPCSIRLRLNKISQKVYPTRDSIESEKKNARQIVKLNGFGENIAEIIDEFFDSELDAGYICAQDGRLGQKIKVYTDHCVVLTNSLHFNKEEISKKLAKLLKMMDRNADRSVRSSAGGALLNGLLRGNLMGAGLGLARAYAADAITDEFFADTVDLGIIDSEMTVYFSDRLSIEFVNCGNEAQLGFIRFVGGQTPVSFYFGGLSAYDLERTEKEMSLFITSLRRIAGKAGHPQKEEPTRTKTESPYETLRELKKLLDEDIITLEEFEAKKKQLLNLS